MISHKHKFLSIRIPKTGSTSVTTILKPYFDIEGEDIGSREGNTYYHHRTTKYMKSHFEKMEWNFDDYFKFAFVRNPFEREVSSWEYAHKIVHMYEKYKETKSNLCPDKRVYNQKLQIVKMKNFKTLCSRQFTDYDTYSMFYRDKHTEKNLLDFIGKFENLQEDFNTICDKIGIPQQHLPHKNKSKHKHYTEYYDDETKQIVAERYAKDIEYFGYKFGE